MFLIFVLLSYVIVNTCADNLSLQNDLDDEIESIFDDLLNGDYVTNIDYGEKYETKNQIQEDEPQLSDGVWKCGNCTNIDESKLLFSEDLDLDANYNENVGYELQIGFSVDNMRCITIETEEITVRRVSGACAGEEVTLGVIQKSHFEVKIYK
ncbi:uncharacterized protein LOC126771494 [Nymphalis io]|uniref:uncharacterized protein LOC126771494 n=1 Tax=Inachis io TaxID=171585 RepID=UPI002168D597|nr:uncharacterized protein LOC126771494 [Nymphalis io]